MLKKLKSIWQYFLINSTRVFDHIYRSLFGLPTLKRSEITPQLYLGGQYRLRSLTKLHHLGITAIVSMRMRKIDPRVKQAGFKTLHLPTIDHTAPTLLQLKTGVEFIQKEIEDGGKVYIHCRMGEERGATMIVAYLISTGMTLEDALTLVKNVRKFINPRKVQIEQLAKFEQKYL